MNFESRTQIRIAEHAQRAIADRSPVVALESTVIAHGLPHPANLETAFACEEAIKQNGATPATIGIVEGVPTIGLSPHEIEALAISRAEEGSRIEKVGLNNLASVIVSRSWGATTVASSLRLAHLAGVRVFCTGGIGGVHRDAAESFDISADLTALGTTPLICVCAGAKAILDLAKTLECLETLGVPVVGYGTHEFPAFYSRTSGLAVDVTIETPEAAAEVAECHWRLGGDTAVLICVPVPEQAAIPSAEITAATEKATRTAALKGVRGKAVTPFLLSEMETLTGGKTLEANRALLVNNAAVAARIAVSLSTRVSTGSAS